MKRKNKATKASTVPLMPQRLLVVLLMHITTESWKTRGWFESFAMKIPTSYTQPNQGEAHTRNRSETSYATGGHLFFSWFQINQSLANESGSSNP